MLKIIELAEMIDLIDDFYRFNGMSKSLFVGGMVGTPIMEYALNTASSYYSMDEILVVDGCQDSVLRKDIKEKLVNLKFWADLFMDNMTSKLDAFNSMGILNNGITMPMDSYADWTIVLNEKGFNGYRCMIVNNAHLIPPNALDMLQQYFGGKAVYITDPFEIHGENFGYAPTIIDSLNKLPKSIAFARSMFDVETRYINTKSKQPIARMDKIRLRSIGKIDGNQYVTDHSEIAQMVWDKQKQIPFNKGHKLWVVSKYINNMATDNHKHEMISLPMHSQVTITASSRKHNLFKIQPHLSDVEVSAEICYDELPDRKFTLHVRPANIIMLHEVPFHFYQNILYVPTENEHPSRRAVYTLMKHCNSLVVAEHVK